jgi:hypothetical protein
VARSSCPPSASGRIAAVLRAEEKAVHHAPEGDAAGQTIAAPTAARLNITTVTRPMMCLVGVPWRMSVLAGPSFDTPMEYYGLHWDINWNPPCHLPARPQIGSNVPMLSHALVLLLAAASQALPPFEVRDDALTEPTDLVRRLTALHQQQPDRAVALARRLGNGDPSAQSALAAWIHGVLARHFTPRPSADPASGSLLLVLSALGERTDRGGFTVAATAGLRMWVRAREIDAPEDLLRLAQTTFVSADSYGGRYLLLLSDLLEARKEPELQAAARTIRQRLTARIRQRLTGVQDAEFDQPSGVLYYWLAYAHSREAIAERRLAAITRDGKQRSHLIGQALMHDSNAATATINGNRPAVTRWFAESERLSGPHEFVTLHLQSLERRAADLQAEDRLEMARQTRAAALRRLVDLSLVDGSAVSELRGIATRLQPGIRWEEYWADELLRFSPVLPMQALRTVSGDVAGADTSRGRWRLAIIWATACVECQPMRQQIETLVREFGRDVIVMVPAADGAEARRHFEISGLSPLIATIPVDLLRSLAVPPGVSVPLLVAPNGRYTRLPHLDWDRMVRMFLARP